MKVSPIANYSYNYPAYNRTKATNPNFKGELNNTQTKKVLKMLQSKLTDVKQINDMSELKPVADGLSRKYSAYGNKSIGAMIIPENELADFIGENASKQYNLNDKIGLCVAAGDVYGPVENWNRAFESIALIIPKSSLR